jgi:MarR family transcriptional regulator, organic hydroperoxide resistance regulator
MKADMQAVLTSLRNDETQSADAMRVWFRFVRLNRRVVSQMTARLKAIGLSVPQFDLLSTLTEREGISQSDLAERLYVTKGNVSGLVDRLVEAGLVERRAIAGDRRSYALHLTDEGRRMARLGIEVQIGFVNASLGQLPHDELMLLEHGMLALRERVRALGS